MGTGDRAPDPSPQELEFPDANVTGPVQIEGVFAALDFDSVTGGRSPAGCVEIESVRGAAYSLDVVEVLPFLIQGPQVIPEKIGIRFRNECGRLEVGSVTEGEPPGLGANHKPGISKDSRPRAGVNPSSQPLVWLLPGKLGVRVGGSEEGS